MHKDTDKRTLLIVDDTAENIDVLRSILVDKYKIKAAINGEKAIDLAIKQPPDLILLDVMMPGIDGYQVCQQLQKHPSTCNVPIIFVTAKNSDDDEEYGLSLGAVDYITKPIRPAIVRSRISTHLALCDQRHHLEDLVKERTAQLNDSRQEIIRRLGHAAEFKDNETGLHTIRMSHYSKFIAQAFSEDQEWVELIYQASPMHDVGKIGISDTILLKPGKLTFTEFEQIKAHTIIGGRILTGSTFPLLQTAEQIALYHHERWDGTGYPHGLKAEHIPLVGRIVALADVFDALTNERPYKRAWSLEEAATEIMRQRGCQFDPVVVDGTVPEAIRGDLVQRISNQLEGNPLAGIVPPKLREGTVGSDARSLGAASLPLSDRFLVDRNVLSKV